MITRIKLIDDTLYVVGIQCVTEIKEYLRGYNVYQNTSDTKVRIFIPLHAIISVTYSL